MSDTGNTDLDHRGSFAQPRYINDLQPTTKFHPSELPADPEAIRRFPKHLIDPDSYTESPGSDSSPEARMERARASFLEHAHKWGGVEKMKEFLADLIPGSRDASAEVSPAADQDGEEDSASSGSDNGADASAAGDESPDAGAEGTEPPAEGATGQSEAGPTGVPGAEQPAGDVPPSEPPAENAPPSE